MKTRTIRFTNFSAPLGLLGVLVLLAGALVVPAQEYRHQGDHEQHEGHGRGHHKGLKNNPQAKGSAQPPRQLQHDRHPHRQKQEAREWQQHRGWEKQAAWHGNPNWEGGRATHWQSEHATWVDRGGYGGYYITRVHYHAYFGPNHWFRIRTRPLIFMGYPRFYYRNYTFMMVDPWPEDWDMAWYESDDVYIDYSDGYYLYNRRHPGVAIAVTVVR